MTRNTKTRWTPKHEFAFHCLVCDPEYTWSWYGTVVPMFSQFSARFLNNQLHKLTLEDAKRTHERVARHPDYAKVRAWARRIGDHDDEAAKAEFLEFV